MKHAMFFKLKYIGLAAIAAADPMASAQANLEIECAVYTELTGQALPCSLYPTVKVTQEQYDAAMAARSEGDCKAAVHAEYGRDLCAQRLRLSGAPAGYEGREEEIIACTEALAACKAPAEPEEPKERIRVFD